MKISNINEKRLANLPYSDKLEISSTQSELISRLIAVIGYGGVSEDGSCYSVNGSGWINATEKELRKLCELAESKITGYQLAYHIKNLDQFSSRNPGWLYEVPFNNRAQSILKILEPPKFGESKISSKETPPTLRWMIKETVIPGNDSPVAIHAKPVL